MKKEVIVVPTGICFLKLLAYMEKWIKNSWIFFNSSTIEKIRHSYNIFCGEGKIPGTLVLKKKATDNYPEIRIVVDMWSFNSEWKPILSISYSNTTINFTENDPEEIYFFKIAD